MSTSRDRELSTLSYVIKEPAIYRDLLRENRDSLSNFQFDYPMAVPIYKAVTKTIEKFGQAPTEIECLGLMNEYADTHNFSQVSRDTLLRETKNVYSIESSPQSGEVFVNHIYAHESRALTSKISGMSREAFAKCYDELQMKFTTLKNLGKSSSYDLGVSPYAKSGITKMVAKLHESNSSKVISTGWNNWDDKLDGGFYPGEVVMILGATGSGKSAFSVNIADSIALTPGKRAVYITFDNTSEEMAGRWYAKRLGQKITRDFDPKKVERDLQEKVWGKGQEHNLRLLNWMPQRFTALDVGKALTLLKEEFREYDLSHGVNPRNAGHIDLLVIDYLEKVKPLKSSDLFRQDLFLIVEEFVIIAKQWEMPVIVLSQATKEAMKVETAQIWMSGESYAKLHPCAHVAIICQSDDDRLQVPNRIKLVNGKNRRAETNYVVNFIFDKGTQTIIEDPLRPITSLNSVISTGADASGSYEHEMKKTQDLQKAIKVARDKKSSADYVPGKVEPTEEDHKKAYEKGVADLKKETGKDVSEGAEGRSVHIDTHLNGVVA